MATISIFNATIVTMDESRKIIANGAVILKGDRIVAVGESNEIKSTYGEEGQVIDATGMLVMPGLINSHTHTDEILLRGLGADLGPLLNWSNAVLQPAASALDDEIAYVSALLSCVEMIKSGTTFFVDHLCMNTSEAAVDKTAEAIRQTGVKGLIARGMFPQTERLARLRPYRKYPSFDDEVDHTEKAIQKWHQKQGGRILVCPAPVITAFVEDDLILEAKRLSDVYGVPIHSHVAEVRDEVQVSLEVFGKKEIERLNELGVLGPSFHVVHGVWVDDAEVKLMGRTRSNLIHCPVSNMYLGSGVAPVTHLLKAGVNVALGTDVSCNENNDMIQVMKAEALLHKVHNLDPVAICAGQVLEMATLGGAKALGVDRETASIEAGKKADIILIGMRKPHITPAHRVVPSLVYCANGADVETVIIDGELVMENRQVKTVDEKKITEMSLRLGDELVERAKLTTLKNRPQFS